MCVYCMFIYVLESVQHIGQRTVALNCALEINSLAFSKNSMAQKFTCYVRPQCLLVYAHKMLLSLDIAFRR